MRGFGFVLAMAALLLPSLSYSQNRQPASANASDAMLQPAEVPADKPTTTAASERRSLMGMVMDVVIASAEQQSAQQASRRAAGARNAPSVQLKPAVATPAAAVTLSPDLVTREQVAVESEP